MKMKKIVALVTASALCLGMSMTVFADNSPNEGLARPTGSGYVDNGSQDPANEGRYLYVNNLQDAKDDIADQVKKDNPNWTDEAVQKEADKRYDAVKDVFTDDTKASEKASELLGRKVDGVVVSAGDFKLYRADGTVINPTDVDWPKNGIDRAMPIAELGDGYKQVEVGDKIAVLHYNTAKNTWEVQEVTVVGNPNGQGYVTVHFDSLSPVAFLKVMSNGQQIKVDANGNPIKDKDRNVQVVNKTTTTKTTQTVATGRSPKTGEF